MRSRMRAGVTVTAGLLVLLFGMVGCTPPAGSGPDTRSETSSVAGEVADGTFPALVNHRYGVTRVERQPARVVVVGLTEQDVLLELGIVPIATTEWYGEQPFAVWPWARELLGDAKPEVLTTSDGLQFERIVALAPDLIVGTNAGLSQQDYDTLSRIAPTITSVAGATPYFSDWREQTRQIGAAVGKAATAARLIDEVDQAYAAIRQRHPEFAGLSATFSQGAPYDGNLYVYPGGLNTDFLTELGFTMTPGLDQYVPEEGSQALISAENVNLLDTDIIVFATETPDDIDELMSFGTLGRLPAVASDRSVYTDADLAGAIYFLTPLSQKYVLDRLVPHLDLAARGQSPRSPVG